MTVIDDRQVMPCRPMRRGRAGNWSARWSAPRVGSVSAGSGRAPAGPSALPRWLRCATRTTAIPVSRAAQPAARPVSATVTVALGGVAALITLWLGFLAHFSGDQPAPAAP